MFSCTITPEKVMKEFVVYKLTNISTDEIVFVGACKYSELFTLKELVGNPLFDREKIYTLTVLYEMSNWFDCINKKAQFLHTMPVMPDLNRTSVFNRYTLVRCIETGEIFKSCSVAARHHGVDQGAISKLLSGKRGYKSVNGKTYERIGYYGYDGKPINPKEIIM